VPRVPCPECAINVVVDPMGRCPEGHQVAPTAAPRATTSKDTRPPAGDSSRNDPPPAGLDDLGELAALEAAVEQPVADDRGSGDLDPVFARFAELMREREPEPDERGDEPFTIWDGPDAEPTTPAAAADADGPLFPPPEPTSAPAAAPAPPEPPATTEVPAVAPVPPPAAVPPSEPEPVPPPAVETADSGRPAQADEPTRPGGGDAGPPMVPLKDGWVGFTARSSPTSGRKRRG
jgi:hypothetical protein